MTPDTFFGLTPGDIRHLVTTYFCPAYEWNIVGELRLRYQYTAEEAEDMQEQVLEIEADVEDVDLYDRERYTYTIWIDNSGDFDVEQDVGGASYPRDVFGYVEYLQSKGFPHPHST